jgi:hypothetical protein
MASIQHTKTTSQRGFVEFLNSLTAMGPYMGPLKNWAFRTSLISFWIFVRCQRLIARNVADGFLLFSLADMF